MSSKKNRALIPFPASHSRVRYPGTRPDCGVWANAPTCLANPCSWGYDQERKQFYIKYINAMCHKHNKLPATE